MPIAYSMASYWVHKQVHIQMSAWIADQKGLDAEVCGEICQITSKAIGVMIPASDASLLQWLPLSQIEEIAKCDGIHTFERKRQWVPEEENETESWREYWQKQQQKQQDDANKTRYEEEARSRNEKFRKEREQREADERRKRDEQQRNKDWEDRQRQRQNTGSSAGSSDPYQVLGITRQATQDEINTAYKLKIRALHPDMNPARIDSDVAELLNKKSAAINAAWELLKR